MAREIEYKINNFSLRERERDNSTSGSSLAFEVLLYNIPKFGGLDTIPINLHIFGWFVIFLFSFRPTQELVLFFLSFYEMWGETVLLNVKPPRKEGRSTRIYQTENQTVIRKGKCGNLDSENK